MCVYICVYADGRADGRADGSADGRADGRADGKGDGESMFAKGEKIRTVGASKHLCGPDKAWCIAQNPATREVDIWTRATAGYSERFGPCSPHIIAGSIGCSHWNQYLHAMNSNPEKATFFAEDPILKELCEDGLSWSMVSIEVVTRYPKLGEIMSKTLNIEHHVGEGETWTQQLKHIVNMVEEHQKVSHRDMLI